MKLFFSAPAIAKSEDKEEEISNSAIKSHLENIVKNEDKDKPLSDEKLLKIILNLSILLLEFLLIYLQ